MVNKGVNMTKWYLDGETFSENELLTTEELTAEVQAIHDIDIQCSEKEDISHEEALEILGKADRFWR